MQYVGNKTKIVKELVELMLARSKELDGCYEGLRYYFEPFVGSAAVISAMPSHFRRIGNDKNPYLIALLCAVRDGWVPPETVTEKEYNEIRRSPSKYPAELVGFVSFACSFGGKSWGGYAANSARLNYAALGSRSLVKMAPRLRSIEFRCGTFEEMFRADYEPPKSIIYCDPPYQGTTGYDYGVNSFGEFWRWCKKAVDIGCKVFVSGYPENRVTGWDIVWAKDVKTVMDLNRQSWHGKRTEVLFMHESQSGIVHETVAEVKEVDCCPKCRSTNPAEFGEECMESWGLWHGDNFPPEVTV